MILSDSVGSRFRCSKQIQSKVDVLPSVLLDTRSLVNAISKRMFKKLVPNAKLKTNVREELVCYNGSGFRGGKFNARLRFKNHSNQQRKNSRKHDGRTPKVYGKSEKEYMTPSTCVPQRASLNHCEGGVPRNA